MTLMDYSNQIEALEQQYGLSFYPQEFEFVNKSDMIGYMTYAGFINHYPHWSFGKLFDRLKSTKTSFEVVINNNPCIAYLLKTNSQLTQILIIAHVFAHNDFFKNNVFFTENQGPKDAITMFKYHSQRIREYIKEFGEAAVEDILTAAHSIKSYCAQGSLLDFIAQNTTGWQSDIIQIVAQQNRYFQPQIETKIINEGWASFWHYKILNELNLPADKYFEFISLHNTVISPTKGTLNPYYIGFKIWTDIYKKNDIAKMLAVREFNNDSSFIRNYLTEKLCAEMNLFSYTNKDAVSTVKTSSNEFTKIQTTLINHIGKNSVPEMEIVEYNNNMFTILHIFDGRELDLLYTTETLKHIQSLLKREITLITDFSGITRKIICDNQNKIYVQNFTS